jgi:flagellar assembly factor FliW
MIATMTKSRPAGSAAGVPDELPVIEFVHPMPGFPESQRFTLHAVDETGTLYGLRSLDHAELEFLVVPPASFYPAYAPEIDDEAAADLGLTSTEQAEEHALVLLVVHAGRDLASTTVNLRAPIVVNTGTSRAAQIILEDVSLSVAAPLLG